MYFYWRKERSLNPSVQFDNLHACIRDFVQRRAHVILMTQCRSSTNMISVAELARWQVCKWTENVLHDSHLQIAHSDENAHLCHSIVDGSSGR
jgi:hypothetical protein